MRGFLLRRLARLAGGGRFCLVDRATGIESDPFDAPSLEQAQAVGHEALSQRIAAGAPVGPALEVRRLA